MPLTLNVNLAKELRQPDGRSLGATCDVRVKLDAAAHTQPISQAVATKRVLLEEAMDPDDLNDRMAPALDDLDT